MEITAYRDHVIQQKAWCARQVLLVAIAQTRFLITTATVLQLIIGIRVARLVLLA